MRARGAWHEVSLSLFALLVSVIVFGCEGFGGRSKVAQGERYRPEDSRYETFFASVHEHQAASASWTTDAKNAKRPLASALGLQADASDSTVVSATRARARKAPGKGATLDLASTRVTPVAGGGDSALYSAVEQTMRLELDRARKLQAAHDRLDGLAKEGAELHRMADREYENSGAQKADEKKTQKSRELRRELAGAEDVVRTLARRAASDVDDVEDFLDDLASALAVDGSGPARSRPRNRTRPRRFEEQPKPEPPSSPAPVETPKVDAKSEAPKSPPRPVQKVETPRPKPVEKPTGAAPEDSMDLPTRPVVVTEAPVPEAEP